MRTYTERRHAFVNARVPAIFGAQHSSSSRSGSYSAVITRTSGACIPPNRAQPAPAEIARHGFEVPRARSASFPNVAESGRKTDFIAVKAGFGPSSKRRIDTTSHTL